ncbi:MAG: hypothetical protein RL367_1404 [Pseudomonadota bacterium]
MDIKGKKVLITGGTDGIGLEMARQMQAKGAHVSVCGRRQALLDSAASEGFDAIPADLTSPKACATLAALVAGKGIDILINNAGAGSDYDINAPIDLADNDRVIFLNLNAPVHLITHLLPALRARPEAAIVNVTSGLAIAPRGGGPIYCATKAGLRSFTMALRYQLRGTRVHVIEALPPVVETRMTAGRAGNKMSPAACARQIVAAIEANRAQANVGMVKILKAVYSLSPALARSIMIKF